MKFISVIYVITLILKIIIILIYGNVLTGYLIDRGLSKSLKTFIQECPDLGEFYQVMKSGKVPPTTIMGQSLMDILNEFAELKLKAVRKCFMFQCK